MSRINHAEMGEIKDGDFGLMLINKNTFGRGIACTHEMKAGNPMGIKPFKNIFILLPDQADNNLFCRIEMPGSTWSFRWATLEEEAEAREQFQRERLYHDQPMGNA